MNNNNNNNNNNSNNIKLNEIIDIANQINKINDNPYFINLTKKINIGNFIKSQEGFIKAVDYWSRILGIMISKLPSDKERIVIIRNLLDEHGFGNLNESHVNTFKMFMESLGFDGYKNTNSNDEHKYDYYESSKSVNQFINRIKNAINNENWTYSISVLAMIEYTYITVSKNIHNYVSNFINSSEINHYGLHETIDVDHANDFFELLLPYYENNKEIIIKGLNEGYETMYELYDSLNVLL